jgi:hypothetical protein
VSYTDKSSHSEVESFAACERKHYYTYGQKVQGRTTSDSLARGNVGHQALSQYYQLCALGAPEDEAVDAAFDAAKIEMKKYNVFDPDKLLGQTITLLGMYFDNYAEEYSRIKVLEVETMYNAQLTSEFVMPMRLDVILEFPPYGVLAWDHKFCNDFFDVDKIDLNPQLPRYWAALDALGKRVDGVWYNEIRYRNTKENNADPSQRFKRTNVPLKPAKVVTVMREHMMIAKRITHLKSLPLVEWERSVVRNTLACNMCQFPLLCSSDLDGGQDSDLIVNSFYEPREYR